MSVDLPPLTSPVTSTREVLSRTLTIILSRYSRHSSNLLANSFPRLASSSTLKSVAMGEDVQEALLVPDIPINWNLLPLLLLLLCTDRDRDRE